MALKIGANTFFTQRYLKVYDWGVKYVESAVFGGGRKFFWGQIDYLLMSPTDDLSFQAGNEVFTIPIKPKKFKHQQALKQMQDMLAGSAQRVTGFPVISSNAP